MRLDQAPSDSAEARAGSHAGVCPPILVRLEQTPLLVCVPPHPGEARPGSPTGVCPPTLVRLEQAPLLVCVPDPGGVRPAPLASFLSQFHLSIPRLLQPQRAVEEWYPQGEFSGGDFMPVVHLS